MGEHCLTSQKMNTDFTSLSVLGDSKGDSKSKHDKIEEKLKACTQAENNAEQVTAATYQGGL